MEVANKIEVDIVTKIAGNDSFNKIKQGLSSVVKGNDKVQAAIKRTGTSFSKIKSTVKNATSGASTALSGLKNKINNSFPVRAVNTLKSKIQGLKGTAGGVGNSFVSMAKKIATVALAFMAISKGIAFAQSSIEDYKESAVIATKLKANIGVVKGYKNDAERQTGFENIQKKTVEIMYKGVYDDDLIAAGAAQLSTFQMTDKEITKLLPKMTDMVANSRGLNGTAEDFYGTANMIGKSITTGQLAPLRKVGITMSDNDMKLFKTLNQTERVAMMEKILSENVGKVNEELAKTPLGRIQNAENIWGNMKETVGEGLVKVLAQLAPVLQIIAPHIEKLAVKFGEFVDKIVASGVIKDTFLMIKNTIKGVMDSFTNSGGLDIIKGHVVALKENFILVADSAKKFFDALNLGQFAKGILQGITLVVKGISAAFKIIKPILDPILVVIGKILKQLAPFIAPIAAIVAGFMSIAPIIAAIGAAIGAILSPVGLIIAAIVAVILIFKNWDKIVKWVGDRIKAVFTAVSAFFKAIWDGIKAYFNIQWQSMMVIVNFVINGIKSYIQALVAYWQGVWNFVKTIFTTQWQSMMMIVRFVIDGVKIIIQGIVSKVSEVITNVKQKFTDGFNAVKGIVSGIVEGIKGIFGGIVDKAREVVDKVKGFFSKGFKTEVTVQENVVKSGGAKPAEKWTGTKNFKGGMTWVAERGRELIKPPGGQPFIANTPTLLNLKSGTEILNNSDTNKALKSKIDDYKDRFNNSKIGDTVNQFLGNKSESTNNNQTTVNNSNKEAPQVNLTFQIFGDPGENQGNLIRQIKEVSEEVFNDVFYKLLVKDGDISG